MTDSLARDILDIYATLDEEIARVGPTCRACGECCDFHKQGYTLFATSAEVALVTTHVPRPERWPDEILCPFQDAPQCSNRDYRPLGCRTYFCDPKLGSAGAVLYGRYHDRLKAVIERHGHEYRYAPFMELLAETWHEAAGSERAGNGD